MSRSGKTASASRSAASAKRVVAWDPQGDWLKFGLTQCATVRELALELSAHTTSPARLAFVGGRLRGDDFSKFCRAAFAWGRLARCVVVVEELSWVTHPGKAPDGWLELVTGGLKYGIDIVSITQRPAESDKTALSQATVIRCFQMERADDVRYMAKELRVDVARVDALKRLEYLEKDRRAGTLKAKRITF